MNDAAHILVIEDEVKLATLLRDYLVAANYRVSVHDSGAGASVLAPAIDRRVVSG